MSHRLESLQRACAQAAIADPSGPCLLPRRAPEVWRVPDVPGGWRYREHWTGDPRMVPWIGGPPAVAAFAASAPPIERCNGPLASRPQRLARTATRPEQRQPPRRVRGPSPSAAP